MYQKLVLKFLLVFPGRQVEKRMFPYRKPTAYMTSPCATALACDSAPLAYTYRAYILRSMRVQKKIQVNPADSFTNNYNKFFIFLVFFYVLFGHFLNLLNKIDLIHVCHYEMTWLLISY